MPQITGRWQDVKMNGEQIPVLPGASFQEGGVTRESVTTDQGTVGYKETIVPARFTGTMIHREETDLKAIRAFKDGQFVCRTDTGVGWVITDAFTVEVGDLSDGQVPFTVEGQPADRI